jgi:hypothetical protein
MESQAITKLDKNLPLRAYPKDQLDKVVIMELLPYLCRLMSLTDEVSANRLEMALPAIKEQCIGMGFKEIKKMFEMYVDSKLSLKPIPNYFDRILLGKIVSNYKSLNKPKKMEEKEISEEEKEFIMAEAIDRLKKEVAINKKISSICVHVYDHLDEKQLLPKEKEYKVEIYERAKKVAKAEAASKATHSLEEHRNLKAAIEKIDSPKNSNVINIAKRLVLEDYFKKI